MQLKVLFGTFHWPSIHRIRVWATIHKPCIRTVHGTRYLRFEKFQDAPSTAETRTAVSSFLLSFHLSIFSRKRKSCGSRANRPKDGNDNRVVESIETALNRIIESQIGSNRICATQDTRSETAIFSPTLLLSFVAPFTFSLDFLHSLDVLPRYRVQITFYGPWNATMFFFSTLLRFLLLTVFRSQLCIEIHFRILFGARARRLPCSDYSRNQSVLLAGRSRLNFSESLPSPGYRFIAMFLQLATGEWIHGILKNLAAGKTAAW